MRHSNIVAQVTDDYRGSQRVGCTTISVYLIPEEQVSLAKFKFIQIVVLHEAGSHDIEDSKQPTSARVLLVGHWLAFSLDLMGEDMLRLLHDFPRDAGFDGIRFRADILRQQITAVRIKLCAQLVEYLRWQAICTNRKTECAFNENSVRKVRNQRQCSTARPRQIALSPAGVTMGEECATFFVVFSRIYLIYVRANRNVRATQRERANDDSKIINSQPGCGLHRSKKSATLKRLRVVSYGLSRISWSKMLLSPVWMTVSDKTSF